MRISVLRMQPKVLFGSDTLDAQPRPNLTLDRPAQQTASAPPTSRSSPTDDWTSSSTTGSGQPTTPSSNVSGRDRRPDRLDRHEPDLSVAQVSPTEGRRRPGASVARQWQSVVEQGLASPEGQHDSESAEGARGPNV